MACTADSIIAGCLSSACWIWRWWLKMHTRHDSRARACSSRLGSSRLARVSPCADVARVRRDAGADHCAGDLVQRPVDARARPQQPPAVRPGRVPRLKGDRIAPLPGWQARALGRLGPALAAQQHGSIAEQGAMLSRPGVEQADLEVVGTVADLAGGRLAVARPACEVQQRQDRRGVVVDRRAVPIVAILDDVRRRGVVPLQPVGVVVPFSSYTAWQTTRWRWPSVVASIRR